MELFYEQLNEGHSSVTALQRAQGAYLDEEGGINQHPYFWAAFTHLGQGGEVTLQQRGSWVWWGVPVILVLLLVLRFGVVGPVREAKR